MDEKTSYKVILHLITQNIEESCKRAKRMSDNNFEKKHPQILEETRLDCILFRTLKKGVEEYWGVRIQLDQN